MCWAAATFVRTAGVLATRPEDVLRRVLLLRERVWLASAILGNMGSAEPYKEAQLRLMWLNEEPERYSAVAGLTVSGGR
jgi:hypothetical protein